MSASLSWNVSADDGAILVAVRGLLDVESVARLRPALLKALAEQPTALLVDLADTTLGDRLALSVFTAVSRQAAMWPGVPVLLCAPSPVMATALLRPAYHRLIVHPDVRSARAAATGDGTALLSLVDDLLPISGAARHARDMATEVCARWELPHLTWPASLVASELVSNAVEHAGTMVTLRFVLRPRYLHIAARDGSEAAPVPPPDAGEGPGGRGLLLVRSVAAHWGSMPCEGGKVVWATLPREAAAQLS